MSTPTFVARTACTPTALSRLFNEPYDAVCHRIRAAGGDYVAVTCDVLHRVLAPHGIVSVRSFTHRPRIFSRWRPRRGRWVAVVTGWGSSNGHCVTVDQGKAMDNGWVNDYPGSLNRYDTLRVHAAWQLQEAA